jgi:hypothetical protein
MLPSRTHRSGAVATISTVGAAIAITPIPVGTRRASLTAATVGSLEVGGVTGFFHEISDIEKGISFEADLDERTLHARKNAGDAAVIDGSGESVLVLALVVDLGEFVVFDDGKTGLMGGTANIDFFRHCFCFLPGLYVVASGRQTKDRERVLAGS